MPFEPHELDAIKQAAAVAIADAGSSLMVLAPERHALAIAVLEAIDRAAEDPTDPRPFAPGRKVRVKGTGIPGVVVRTVEDAGELHTVVVRLALEELEAETPFSPRELEVIE